MRHVIVADENDCRFLDPTAYLDLLPALAADLPAGARAFATEAGHYDFGSQRCVKDLKPDTVLSGRTSGERWLELRFRHNCWKHEEDLAIRYSGVVDAFPASSCRPPVWAERNAITLDEILPHEHGCRHEMCFDEGSLTVVSRDLTAVWTEAVCPDKPAPPGQT
ncbi:hypothetical protein Athai_62330 [Actinocatenispora thailandica]|uniref:Uncharacterized protein n=1 Tax=Actinocatenispora thailandica TaxID=227318 RepID=A0A7R7DVP6_9ACTN|nr:hypothetical protein [Actinocatenispora thailandica]BCJ38730.1 hypothetical protein Athai_62330 [Actinocatenispora thailandica]